MAVPVPRNVEERNEADALLLLHGERRRDVLAEFLQAGQVRGDRPVRPGELPAIQSISGDE